MILLAALFMLQVAQGSRGAQVPLPEVVTRSRLDRSRGVDFHALAVPETVYVGQQSTYQLGVFVDAETRQRLRRNPEFVPPESRALLAYDLPDRSGGFTGTIDGRAMEVHAFRRAVFALTPGRYEIAPARLTYALPQSASFFSREESFSLRSELVTIVAIPVPAANRPPDWLGAVGVWRASVSMDSTAQRSGDPYVLTLRIEGQGNVTLLARPALQLAWAHVVKADERVRVDSSGALLRGVKEFDWLVTPQVAGLQKVPAIRYPFFNPFSRQYEVTASAVLTVRATAGAAAAVVDSTVAAPAEAPPAVDGPVLPLRPELGAPSSALLGQSAFARALFALAPLLAVLAWGWRRPRRQRKPITHAERLAAMARDGAALPAEIRNTLLAALAQRVHADPAALARPGAWERALALEGVLPATAADVASVLGALDAAAFGGDTDVGSAALAARAQTVLAKVDAEARRRVPRPRRQHATAALVLFLAFAASAAALVVQSGATQSFAQGTAAYASGDARRAARFFADAAKLEPHTAAAWANFGSASWAVSDTGNAVLGWQRALRLDPTSADVRQRLLLVRAPQDAGPARVLPMPAPLPALLALVIWCIGWGASIAQLWRRRPALRLMALTLVLGGGATTAALSFERSLDDRGLVVVIEADPMRSLPALSAESGTVPIVGEVGTVEARQGVWLLVRLDATRAGWIPAASTGSLARD